MELTYFLHAGANSWRLKVISLIFEWMLSKMGVATYLVHKSLKSVVSEEWLYGMNGADFLNADCDAIIFC